jgi:hypothetical protein
MQHLNTNVISLIEYANYVYFFCSEKNKGRDYIHLSQAHTNFTSLPRPQLMWEEHVDFQAKMS